MKIGDLRHRIEIGRYTHSTDQWGDPVPEQWQAVCTVWAAVEALTGRLYFEARQTQEQSDHRITIRWRKGIEPGMVVRYCGREFTIHAVLDKDGKRKWLELVCREVRPA